MKLQKEEYEQIAECFPRQRKPAKISSLDVLNAVLYVVLLLREKIGKLEVAEEIGNGRGMML